MSPLTWKTFTLDLQISPLTLHLIRVTLKILLIYWIFIDYPIPCRDGPKARSGEPWPSWFFFFYNLNILYIHYIFKFKSKIIILSPLKKKNFKKVKNNPITSYTSHSYNCALWDQAWLSCACLFSTFSGLQIMFVNYLLFINFFFQMTFVLCYIWLLNLFNHLNHSH